MRWKTKKESVNLKGWHPVFLWWPEETIEGETVWLEEVWRRKVWVYHACGDFEEVEYSTMPPSIHRFMEISAHFEKPEPGDTHDEIVEALDGKFVVGFESESHGYEDWRIKTVIFSDDVRLEFPNPVPARLRGV